MYSMPITRYETVDYYTLFIGIYINSSNEDSNII